MFATPQVVNDTNWYLDSGASNHVTKVEYYGSYQVHIGNGVGLSIKHVGQSTFPLLILLKFFLLSNSYMPQL